VKLPLALGGFSVLSGLGLKYRRRVFKLFRLGGHIFISRFFLFFLPSNSLPCWMPHNPLPISAQRVIKATQCYLALLLNGCGKLLVTLNAADFAVVAVLARSPA
jgi:hypothetical protein